MNHILLNMTINTKEQGSVYLSIELYIYSENVYPTKFYMEIKASPELLNGLKAKHYENESSGFI